jgi:hypothetical protein
VLRCKGRSHKAAKTARTRVPMRSTGAEWLVVGTKASWTEGAALFSRDHRPTEANWQQEEPVDGVNPAARLPTVEHWEPCESRGSRTVLGAPGGEIPPGDSSKRNNGSVITSPLTKHSSILPNIGSNVEKYDQLRNDAESVEGVSPPSAAPYWRAERLVARQS